MPKCDIIHHKKIIQIRLSTVRLESATSPHRHTIDVNNVDDFLDDKLNLFYHRE